MGEVIQWKDKPERYTYRFEKNRIVYEKHYDNLNKARDAATRDLEKQTAVPICIKAYGIIILYPDDIMDAWKEKYQDEPPEE